MLRFFDVVGFRVVDVGLGVGVDLGFRILYFRCQVQRNPQGRSCSRMEIREKALGGVALDALHKLISFLDDGSLSLSVAQSESTSETTRQQPWSWD